MLGLNKEVAVGVAGASLLGGYTFAKAYRSLAEPIPAENNIIYQKTYGGPIASLGTSLGALLGTTVAKNSPIGIAAMAGLGAFTFGVVGDVTHTKLPAEAIVTANMFTGVAVTAASLVSNKYIPRALDAIGDSMTKERANIVKSLIGSPEVIKSYDEITDFFKGNKKFFGFIGKGTITRAVPAIFAGVMHAHHQLAVAGAARKLDTIKHGISDNTNSGLTPANINPSEDVTGMTTQSSIIMNQNISGTYSSSNMNIG